MTTRSSEEIGEDAQLSTVVFLSRGGRKRLFAVPPPRDLGTIPVGV
jgi:hypothetical protein